ncbi:MAG TPA: 3'(2'),5'-bisphosphate nucleotidase CysQ [Allosphingosinicella sp.]|uniref:3'(2'),5'-bisphosphate nucleotidase CysQ n=1 Tax=Allosphingosinicella sp. TaxID=2823234 RepID=UPI002ED9D63D
MSPLLQILIDAALEAGHEIERIYGEGCATETKSDGSPVTAADHAAEAIILARLGAAFPDIPVIAEEEACAGRIPEVGERFFLVDPLDGTRGFVERNGEFTVNIALVEHGSAVAGVIYAPDSHTLYYGAAGEGAFRRREGGEAEAISARFAPPAGLTAIASRTTAAKTAEKLKHLPIADFAPSSSSFKFCMLAEGSADVYPRFGTTMEWDTAAGQAILEAAGGRVMELDEEAREVGPLRYGKVDRTFENPHFIAWGASQ